MTVGSGSGSHGSSKTVHFAHPIARGGSELVSARKNRFRGSDMPFWHRATASSRISEVTPLVYSALVKALEFACTIVEKASASATVSAFRMVMSIVRSVARGSDRAENAEYSDSGGMKCLKQFDGTSSSGAWAVASINRLA